MSDITWISRPSSIEDLAEHERRPHVIAEVPGLQWCTAYPEVGRHLLAALGAATEHGLTVDPEGRITVPLTEEEQTAAVVSAQRSWDYSRDRYLAAVEDPASVTGYARSGVNAFAAREGRDPIDWPADS
jgi:hypothetical protein